MIDRRQTQTNHMEIARGSRRTEDTREKSLVPNCRIGAAATVHGKNACSAGAAGRSLWCQTTCPLPFVGIDDKRSPPAGCSVPSSLASKAKSLCQAQIGEGDWTGRVSRIGPSGVRLLLVRSHDGTPGCGWKRPTLLKARRAVIMRPCDGTGVQLQVQGHD